MEIQEINSEISAHKYLSTATSDTDIETEIFKIETFQLEWQKEKESIEREVASRPEGQVNNFKIDKLIGLYFLLKILPSYLLALDNILKDEEEDYKQVTKINTPVVKAANKPYNKDEADKSFIDMIFDPDADKDYEEWKSFNGNSSDDEEWDEDYDEWDDYNEDEEN